jgi:hypothetical protein
VRQLVPALFASFCHTGIIPRLIRQIIYLIIKEKVALATLARVVQASGLRIYRPLMGEGVSFLQKSAIIQFKKHLFETSRENYRDYRYSIVLPPGPGQNSDDGHRQYYKT